MTDKREFVTLEVATGMLDVRAVDDGDGATRWVVHTFRQARGVLLGANWDLADLLGSMAAATHIEVTGPAAQAMGHGLVIKDEGLLFIATKESPP